MTNAIRLPAVSSALSAYQKALNALRDGLTDAPAIEDYLCDNPADFIEQHIIDPDVGAIRLHPEQRAVLEAMAERDDAGLFKYSTWLYSAPKKSAKTTIGAGVALWQAWQQAHGEIYIIGNDLKQADSRMSQIIRYTIQHHPTMHQHAKITQSSYKIVLANGTRIESVPVDPRGEAGMNPSGLFWTEAWGAIGEKAERMWSEATLSPTRRGKSFKFVESYAGFTGQSTVLERLYTALVKDGTADADVPELYRNGGMIGYWCTRRYLPWQANAADYYHEEEATKTPSEFRRQHGNEWVDAEEAFVELAWWDACRGDVPALQPKTLLVVAVDASVDGDCTAIIGVSREGDITTVRYEHIITPSKDNPIDFDAVERELEQLDKDYYVLEFAYDPYQLESVMQRLRTKGLNCQKFEQGIARLMADKGLHDDIRDRRIVHDGKPALRAHVEGANKKIDGDSSRLRIVKRTEKSHIDGLVALSMANARARKLNM